MGLWSRFWSVVPKAVVKSGRDAFERATETASDEEEIENVEGGIETAGVEVTSATAVPTPETDTDAERSDDAPTEPVRRQRTL